MKDVSLHRAHSHDPENWLVNPNISVDVSVVIPAHNHAHFIRDAVESVIRQTAVTLEIIVVDDGSDDDPHDALTGIDFSRLVIIKQRHCGAGAARNTGSSIAAATYLAFLDADDLLEANRLCSALDVLNKSHSAIMSFAMMQEFLDSSLTFNPDKLPEVRRMRGVSASGCVIARTTFDRIGGFDPHLQTGEFMDWFIRAARLGIQVHVDDEVLVRRRVHSGNRDRRSREINQDYARLLLKKVKFDLQG